MAGFGGFGGMFRRGFGGGRSGMSSFSGPRIPGGGLVSGLPDPRLGMQMPYPQQGGGGMGQQGGGLNWKDILQMTGGALGGYSDWQQKNKDRDMQMDQFNQRQALAEKQYADEEERKRLHREALARQSLQRQRG